MIKESLFYAKILLFGEYGIIEDSMGLSIPYDFYKGKLIKKKAKTSQAEASNQSLKDYLIYLNKLQKEENLIAKLDLEKLSKDIEAGMYFDSSIPQGFGVGSSGALCAAIYEAYSKDELNSKDDLSNEKMLNLKKALGQMESYFHGKSSGLDPLICYLNLPVLIKSKTNLDTVGIPVSEAKGKGAIFLLDSGQPGETQSMVNIFLEKCKQEGFRKMFKQFIKHNDECIKSFLNKDFKPLFNSLSKLSQILLDNFTPMIPSDFHKLWKDGIESKSYYLKLCGSGGGGYILGFTEDISKAKKMLKGHQMEVIYNF